MSNVPVKPLDAETHPPLNGAHPLNQQQLTPEDVRHFKQMSRSMGGGQENLNPKTKQALVQVMEAMAARIEATGTTSSDALMSGEQNAGIASIKAQFTGRFSALAQDTKAFHSLMQQVYGPGVDYSKVEALRQQALAGDFSGLPRVEIVDAQTLQGNHGAYDSEHDVIYLSEHTLGDTNQASQVYSEEVGHALDSRLNPQGDSTGDEGELFQRLLAGETLSPSEIAAIRSENDHGVINVAGRETTVEFSAGDEANQDIDPTSNDPKPETLTDPGAITRDQLLVAAKEARDELQRYRDAHEVARQSTGRFSDEIEEADLALARLDKIIEKLTSVDHLEDLNLDPEWSIIMRFIGFNPIGSGLYDISSPNSEGRLNKLIFVRELLKPESIEDTLAINTRLETPINPEAGSITTREHLKHLIDKGKYGEAAALLADIKTQEEHHGNLDSPELAQEFDNLINALNEMESSYGLIQDGSLSDINSKLSVITETLNNSSSFILTDLKQRVIESIAPILSHDFFQIQALFNSGQHNEAADQLDAIATQLEANNPQVAAALHAKAAEMRTGEIQTVDAVDTPATHQKEIDQILTELESPDVDEGTRRLNIENIINNIPDGNYEQFLTDMKEQGVLDKLFNEYALLQPPFGLGVDPASTNRPPTQYELYLVFANKGASQVQNNQWYVDNVNNVVPQNAAYYDSNGIHEGSISSSELTGVAMLAQTEGHEDLAASLYGAYGGSNGQLSFHNNFVSGTLAPSYSRQENFAISAIRIRDDLLAQWNNTDDAGKRDLVTTWTASGEAEAISVILGEDFAAYHPAENLVDTSSIRISLDVAGQQLAVDIAPKLESWENQLNGARLQTADQYLTKENPLYGSQEGTLPQTMPSGLSMEEAQQKVAASEAEIRARYEAMSPEELDAKLKDFGKYTMPGSLDGDPMYDTSDGISSFEKMIAFDVKISRLKIRHEELINQRNQLQQTLDQGGDVSLSEVNELQTNIASLEEQIVATGEQYHYVQKVHGVYPVTDQDVIALSEQMNTSLEEFNQAIVNAKAALGDGLDANWFAHSNPELLAKALELKAVIQKLEYALQQRPDLANDETRGVIETAKENINQVVEGQRQVAAQENFNEGLDVEILADAGIFDLGDIEFPEGMKDSIVTAQSELSTATEKFTTELMDNGGIASAATYGELREKATAYKEALESLRDEYLAKGDQHRVDALNRKIDQVNSIITKASPESANMTADEVRNEVASTLSAYANENPEVLKNLLKVIFGVNDEEKLNTIIANIQNGDMSWMPNIEIVSSDVLQGNGAAYAGDRDTIYVSEDLLYVPGAVFKAVLEEVGHGLDERLNNGVDTQGDEGELFARLLSGEALTPEQIEEIRNTEDGGTIEINGEQIFVEFNIFEDFWDGVKGIWDGIRDGIKAFGDLIGDIIEGFGDMFVAIASTPAFQVLAVLVNVVPGVGQAASAVINGISAAASIHAGIQGKDLRLVLTGLLSMVNLARTGGPSFTNAQGDVMTTPLFGMSEGTLLALDRVSLFGEFAKGLDLAMQGGDLDIAKFLLGEVGKLDPDSKLNALAKPLELTIKYQEADSDLDRAAAIFQFVGYVADDESQVGALATAIGENTELALAIDEAIANKDWHEVHALTVEFLGTVVGVPPEKLETLDNVLYLGASGVLAVDAFENNEFPTGISELGGVAGATLSLAGADELADNLTVFTDAAEVAADVEKGVDLYHTLRASIKNGDDPETVINNGLALLKFFEEKGLEGISDPALREKIGQALEHFKAMETAWDAKDYNKVVQELRALGSDLGISPEIVEPLAQTIIELGAVAQEVQPYVDLVEAAKSGDIESIIDSSVALAKLHVDNPEQLDAKVNSAREHAKNIDEAWNKNPPDYETVATEIKALGEVLGIDLTGVSGLVKDYAEVAIEIESINETIDKLDLNPEEKTALVLGAIALAAYFKEHPEKLEALKNSELGERVMNALEHTKTMQADWETGNYEKVADDLTNFVKALFPDNPDLHTKVENFTHEILVPAANAMSLYTAYEEQDYEKLAGLLEKMFGPLPDEFDEGLSTPVDRVAALVQTEEFKARFNDLKAVIDAEPKDIDKIIDLAKPISQDLWNAVKDGITDTNAVHDEETMTNAA